MWNSSAVDTTPQRREYESSQQPHLVAVQDFIGISPRERDKKRIRPYNNNGTSRSRAALGNDAFGARGMGAEAAQILIETTGESPDHRAWT